MDRSPRTESDDLDADVILIGGGIMSATLGSMLATLEPDWRIVLVERAAEPATESSAAWNNAGTGHSGYCELNYMPDPTDGEKASSIARQFHLSRQWWGHLAGRGLVDPDEFVHTAPHMDVVFGRRDVEHLRRRFDTLTGNPPFTGLAYTEDPAVIAQWAPLVMDGRTGDGPIAATRHPDGTDVDFGCLTRQLLRIVTTAGGEVRVDHEVRSLRRAADGTWIVGGRTRGTAFELRARFVFAGAGGQSLRLLQSARLPEVRGHAVLPVGAAFLRCSVPEVVARHDAKVYGQADIGAPPMSVPHLDRRVVDGTDHLMFGPYATFGTRLLKSGRWTDFFTTLRWHNLPTIASALAGNLPLLRYLISQLVAGRRRRFAGLQRFLPAADARQWELVPAGQRAQLVAPEGQRRGVIRQGTELVVGGDGTIASLLGASPGASTAVPIMLDLLQRCFPDRWNDTWKGALSEAIPGSGSDANWDAAAVTESLRTTAAALRLGSR